MTVKEYAASKGVSKQSVYQNIKAREKKTGIVMIDPVTKELTNAALTLLAMPIDKVGAGVVMASEAVEVKKDNDAKAEQVEKLTAKVDALTDELTTLKRDKAVIEARLTAANDQIATLKETIRSLESDKQNLFGALGQAQARIPAPKVSLWQRIVESVKKSEPKQ